MKKFKSAKFWLCIALVLCLLSMIGTACMQGNWGSTKVKTYYVTTAELAEMIRANNAETGKDIQIHFGEDAVNQFSFMTLIPKNATADNPVPAIICAHGGANTKEMQMPGYIELARRGFVVITIDMAEHGYSDAGIDPLTGGSYGMLAAAEYAMSLPCVDETQIGVTGHSMGNQACFFTINALNTEGSTQRIAAWVQGAGSMYAPQMTPETAKGMVWTISIDKYDEFDTLYFSSANILEVPMGTGIVNIVYPEFSDSAVTEYQWYTPEGPVANPAPDKALEADTAFRMINPPITHPAFHFSKLGTYITVDGFYAAFGVPSGAKYIDANKQVWPIVTCFELIGLIGFFMLMFPLVSLLSKTPFFKDINRPVPERSEYLSLKDPREFIILALSLVASVIFSFFTYIKLYPNGNRLLDVTKFAANDVPNGIGIWTIACGIFAIVVALTCFGLRKLVYRKSDVKVANPFAVADLSSVRQFFLSVLFSLTVVVLMFIPVYIARYVFNADFRICSFIICAGELKSLPLVFCKYVPIWLLFYIPNAITIAGTRYKDVPDWVMTVVMAVANSIALVVFLFLQYGTLFKTNAMWEPTCGMAGIVAWAIIPCLAFAAVSARYITKKTGNPWVAGMINGTVMCCSTLFATRFMTDFILMF